MAKRYPEEFVIALDLMNLLSGYTDPFPIYIDFNPKSKSFSQL